MAVFIILNTFLMSVTQQRRQLGIMRAIGATRRQVANLVFRKALLLGIAGTILGSVLGVLAAAYLGDAMGELYQTELPPVELTWSPFLWAAVFGIGISLLGAGCRRGKRPIFRRWRPFAMCCPRLSKAYRVGLSSLASRSSSYAVS